MSHFRASHYQEVKNMSLLLSRVSSEVFETFLPPIGHKEVTEHFSFDLFADCYVLIHTYLVHNITFPEWTK